MNDAEFRRKAHALLASIDETWRAECGPCDLDSCADCGKHGAAHKSNCDLVALLAAGPAGSTADAFAASLESGMEKFMRGPCTCDVVGHAPECPVLTGASLDVAMRGANVQRIAAAETPPDTSEADTVKYLRGIENQVLPRPSITCWARTRDGLDAHRCLYQAGHTGPHMET